MKFDIFSKRIRFIYLLLLTTVVTVVFLVAERQARINYPNGAFSLNRNITYSNVDNEYYLDPVENYLSGIGWRRNPAVGNGTYFRRTPGYSLFYLFTREVTPSINSALMLLVFLQFALYLMFFTAFDRILKLLDIKPLIYNISMLFMAVIPYFYHTILGTNTESLSVYLITFFTFFIFSGYKNTDAKKKLIFYILASFFVGYATLTRPYLALFLIFLPTIVFKEYFKTGFTNYLVKNILIGMIPILMIGTWTLRNYMLTKEIVVLEKAYHPESLDRMKPEFNGFFNLARTWAVDGPDFNSYQIPMYFAALSGDTSFTYVENCIKTIPSRELNFYGKENVSNLVRRYQLIVFSQKSYYDKKIAMPKIYAPEELALEADFNSLVSKYRKAHLFNFYVLIPLKYLKAVVLHSNTVGIYLMQEEFRNHLMLNLLRYLSLLIHISLYVFILINFFTTIKDWLSFSFFFLIPVLFLIFFCCYYQSIEQRYYSPILPLLIMGATYSVNKIYLKFQSADAG